MRVRLNTLSWYSANHRLTVTHDVPDLAGQNNQIVGMNILELDTGGKGAADFSQPGLVFATEGDPADPGVVRLPDISGIQGFPTSTTIWHERGGYVQGPAGRLRTDPDGLDGSGAHEWTDYNERMWHILKLFEEMHTDPSLYRTGDLHRSFGDYSWLDPNAVPKR